MLGNQRIGPGIKFLDLYSPYADGLQDRLHLRLGLQHRGQRRCATAARLVAVAFGFRRGDLRDEFLVRLFDEAYALKTAGSRQKVWQLRNGEEWPGDGAALRRMRQHPLRHAGRCGLARHVRRLENGEKYVRCRASRARDDGRREPGQGIHPARHIQQGDRNRRPSSPISIPRRRRDCAPTTRRGNPSAS